MTQDKLIFLGKTVANNFLESNKGIFTNVELGATMSAMAMAVQDKTLQLAIKQIKPGDRPEEIIKKLEELCLGPIKKPLSI